MTDTVMVSGGFDPLHVGHLDLIDAAWVHGDVLVALNSDDWLMSKKGYVFMPWIDRARILGAMRGIVVHAVYDTDNTICGVLRRVRPTYFANGGDRTEADPQEHAMCEELGITELFNVGGPKIRSSEELVSRVAQ